MPKSQRPGFPTFDLALLRAEGTNAAATSAEWERAFAHFQPRLLSYFERRARTVLPLDDLLQEVWLRAFLNITSLDSASALWTWLITIANNLLRDELRRHRPILQSLPEEAPEDPNNIAEFIGFVDEPSGGLTDKIDEMRAKLSEEEWEFLNLLSVDKLSHIEVASRLGLKSAMASRQRLRRIRQRLLE